MKKLTEFLNEALICERFLNAFNKDEMRKYAALEKKLGIKVFPKMIYDSRIISPDELED